MASKERDGLPNFISAVDGRSVLHSTRDRGRKYGPGAPTEALAVRQARHYLNDEYSSSQRIVGIYQLVKIVRPLRRPIEVKDVAVCKPCSTVEEE